MARKELRDAVSGNAQVENANERDSRKRGVNPKKDLNNPQTQAEILHPQVLKMKAGGKTIIVPTEFTIEDSDRGIFEDIGAFARLVGVELGRISPELETVGLEVLTKYPGYLEAALMRSGVRSSVRDLLIRVAHYVVNIDGADKRLRPSSADLEQISDVDYLVCALRFYTDALKRITQAKNAARTASA